MKGKKHLRPFVGKSKSLISLCREITDCLHSSPTYIEKGKIVIRNFNIKNGNLNLSNPSFTDNKTFIQRTARSKPEPGDLIITREAPMGEVCRIPEGIECCLGQRMVLIKPDPNKISSKFLLYALQSQYVQKQIDRSNKTGSIVSNLRIPVLKELKIPFFSEKSNELIGEILALIDKKIELNNRINGELEGMAKLLYDYWFVQFDFPISEEQAIIMGKPELKGKPYKSSGGAMVYNAELKREVPEGWGSGTLGDLGDIVGGSTPSRNKLDNFSKSGISWITPKDLSNNKGNKFISKGELDVTEKGLKEASLRLMPEGTILLSSRAPIGYMAIAQNSVTTNQGFKSFIPTKNYPTVTATAFKILVILLYICDPMRL